ncbi:MAG: RidA family protein [Melioribacteraceae bacterium]|nr:RidA family protein [Melioribacteraceae bacterium]
MKSKLIIICLLSLSLTVSAQSKIKITKTYEAPEAIGPYSQALEANGFVFLSGQIAISPSNNQMVGNNIESQTRQVFRNIKAVLKASGAKLNNVIKCIVFMIDLNDFAIMNKIYEEEFGGHKPARSTIQVARLPKDALIEIECIAVK